MSAFVVSKEHIDALVTAGLEFGRPYGPMRWYWGNPARSNELRAETAGQVGAMLWAENQRSVNFRYTEDEIEEPYQFERMPGTPIPPVIVLKALQCFEYQACESDDWRETEAYAFCQALRKRAISRLGGYDAAPWEISGRDVFLTGASRRRAA